MGGSRSSRTRRPVGLNIRPTDRFNPPTIPRFIMARHGLLVAVENRPVMLFKVTQALADINSGVDYVDIVRRPPHVEIFLESELDDVDAAVARIGTVDGVLSVTAAPPMSAIYGKRIIIMGGGAQVGQVAVGAIAEADRHNIRGERISVDTIPLVGEQELADAVRGVARLPRAKALVLAGSLMGGEIEKAVREVRALGLLVVSLNM